MIKITEEMKASHLLISPEFDELMERVVADPDSVTHIQRKGLLPIAFNYPMNPWPLLGDEKFKAVVAEATTSVMHLCSLVPDRVFTQDMAAFAEMFGYASAQDLENVVAQPNGMDLAMARPDFLLTKDGFKCLETNTSPSLGGAFTHLWRDEYLKLPHIEQFVREKNLDPLHMDATKGFFQLLLDLTETLREGDEINIGLAVDQPLPNNEVSDMFNGAMAEYLKEKGIALTPHFVQAVFPLKTEAEAGKNEVYHRDGSIYVNDKIIHLLLGDLGYYPELMEAFRKGRVCMLNSPASYMMADKRFLAILSHYAHCFTEEEQVLIERFIPWSRIVSEGQTQYKGETRDMVALIKEHPELFVLKAGQGMRGEDVIVGRKADGEKWLKAVETAVAHGNWIVQEVLDSIPFLGKGEDEDYAVHQLVWGFFNYNRQLKGTFVRSQNIEKGSGIVNSASGAIESVLMFI